MALRKELKQWKFPFTSSGKLNVGSFWCLESDDNPHLGLQRIRRLSWSASTRRTFSHTHYTSLQLPLLKTVFLPCLTQTRLEQKGKASMATSLHRAFIEHSIKIRRLYIVRIHNRIQSCAEWREQNGTSSYLYNHDGFNSPTETEKWFAFILRSTGAAVSAVTWA